MKQNISVLDPQDFYRPFFVRNQKPLETPERYVLGICVLVHAHHALTLRCGGVMLSRCDTQFWKDFGVIAKPPAEALAEL